MDGISGRRKCDRLRNVESRPGRRGRDRRHCSSSRTAAESIPRIRIGVLDLMLAPCIVRGRTARDAFPLVAIVMHIAPDRLPCVCPRCLSPCVSVYVCVCCGAMLHLHRCKHAPTNETGARSSVCRSVCSRRVRHPRGDRCDSTVLTRRSGIIFVRCDRRPPPVPRWSYARERRPALFYRLGAGRLSNLRGTRATPTLST